MNVSIAIVDNGILNKFDVDNNISHFYFDYNKIVDGYKEPSGVSGSLCLQQILKQNVKFDILDINVTDFQGKVKFENIVLGIKKAIENRVDIINISPGLPNYSDELFKLCQEAVESNIVIISAAQSFVGEVSYSVDLKNVLRIYSHKNSTNKIVKIDNSTLSINIQGDVEKSEDNSVTLKYTNLACAYFSGIFGKELNYTPIYDKFVLLRKNYGIVLNKSKKFVQKMKFKSCKVYDELKGKKVAVVILPFKEILNINIHLKLSNIVAFYDHNRKGFYSFNNVDLQNDNFDTILVINTHETRAKISNNIMERFSNKQIFCIGEFENNSKNVLIYSHENFITENLSTLYKPVILIAGLSTNLNKLDVQINLAENFSKNSFKTKSITYNPEGVLYGFDVFEYPSKIIFPDTVCSINQYMCYAEEKINLETWIINVGGGCFFINNQNRNIFGKLVAAYLDACNVDIFILCVNNYIDVKILNSYIQRLKNVGVKEVLIVFSKNAFDLSSMEIKNGLRYYKMDSKFYLNSFNYLKENIKAKVFTMSDIQNDRLYDRVIKLLTFGN